MKYPIFYPKVSFLFMYVTKELDNTAIHACRLYFRGGV
jgi:hypothetical protein